MNDDSDDFLHPFLIDHSHIRGRFVRMSGIVEEILSRHAYPESVSRVLGEMLVLSAMLASNMKREGILTLQAKGDGPVKFMIADATQKGALRGYADIDAAQAGSLPKRFRGKPPPLASLFGKGFLALTLDQGDGGRYQGIVDLATTTLNRAICDYFTQSQQAEIAVKLTVSRNKRQGKQRWEAAGIMIERLPQEKGAAPNEPERQAHMVSEEEAEEQWRRISMLMNSVTEEEMVSRTLSSWTILKRLFNEDGVWAYQPRAIKAECRCSLERITEILKTIPKSELKRMEIDGEVTINCQFCNSTRRFTEAQIESL